MFASGGLRVDCEDDAKEAPPKLWKVISAIRENVTLEIATSQVRARPHKQFYVNTGMIARRNEQCSFGIQHLPRTQWYWTSKYLAVPGHGSPNSLLDTTTLQLDLLLHLNDQMKKQAIRTRVWYNYSVLQHRPLGERGSAWDMSTNLSVMMRKDRYDMHITLRSRLPPSLQMLRLKRP